MSDFEKDKKKYIGLMKENNLHNNSQREEIETKGKKTSKKNAVDYII
jgi:hypothetical protein